MSVSLFNRAAVMAVTLSACLWNAQAYAQLVLDPESGKPTVSAEHAVFKQDMWLVQGDIFIGQSSVDPALASSEREESHTANVTDGDDTRGFGLSTTTSLWQNGVVDFEFDDSLNSNQLDRLNIAINHWNEHTLIRLRQRSAVSSDYPLSADFLVFKAGPGCASWVGRQGGAQTVWISDDCGSGSMVHEIGHALGLLHEHTRFDRDSYIDVQLANVETGKLANFSAVSDAVRLLGDYDYDSVMHYGSHFFSGTGKPTLRPLNGVSADRIGQRKSLSQGDIDAINEIYSSDAVLDLQSLYSEDQDVTRVQLDVAVASSQGTYDLLLELQTDAALQYFESHEAWSCQQAGGSVVCRLPQLGGFSSSRLWLDIAGQQNFNLLNTGLVTGTKDSNPGNNGKPPALAAADKRPVNELPLALAALNDAGESLPHNGQAGQGGAGGGGPMLFILMWVLWRLKIRSTMVFCRS